MVGRVARRKKKKHDKLPWLKFYPADWVKDTRVISPESRGVYLDLLLLMHDSDRRGFLARDGQPLSDDELAAFCACSIGCISRAKSELILKHILSQTSAGVLFSRRMIREAKSRRIAVLNGSRGGNPKLKEGLTPPLTGGVKQNVASSLSLNSSGFSGGGGGGGEIPSSLNSPEFLSSWGDWVLHRGEIKKPLTPTASKLALRKLEKLGHDRAVAAIQHSIANGWQGIFEPDGKASKKSTQPNMAFDGIKGFLRENDQDGNAN